MRSILLILLVAGLAVSCSTTDFSLSTADNVDLTKYMGTWYEIARIDFTFEKNLKNTTADYRMNKDGTVMVLNTGFNEKKNRWQSSEGRARMRKDSKSSELEVSFFGPFYSDYNILEIMGDYEYALVAGKNNDYLWILSRTKTIPDDVKSAFLEKAKKLGFDTNRLIWVSQD